MKRIEDSTILITGSTDGIGKRTALGLAFKDARVLLHGRNPEKGKVVLKEIGTATGSGKLEYYNADLSSLDAVRRLAAVVADDHPVLDVLINNAGIGTGRRGEERREVSADGYELRFAVNYLAPFLLTHLLLPTLLRCAPSRIVNVSSLGQSPVNFQDIMLEERYNAWEAYGQSKRALVMLTLDLAEKHKNEGVTVNAVHPGSLLDTKMVREAYGYARGDVQQGADAIIYLAASPEVEGVTGRFFDQNKETTMDRQAYDSSALKKLHRLSCDLTGLTATSPSDFGMTGR
jgi:NAD(P)-dependent dehydrogenase (short-subunit alcohol dehydrogenase family)